ncbi:hypothetical protein FJY69_08785 [candidate division WOR-3 bacterium]|nr:hypothetical protein [candidate division WOR-3 bacterium]
MDQKRTTCPFCLNGCESGVVFNGVEHWMRHFPEAEVNRGRLCPRGNSASIVLDHRDRLCRPLLDGRDTTWAEAETLVRDWLSQAKPEGLAIVYSRARSADEVRRLHGLARELGTNNLVCGHIEPENSFNHRLEGVADATLAQIETARATLLVGDVFSTSPVASWRILGRRYADRKNRFVVIDSIRTPQSGFAHCFVQVKPGTEPFALVALASLIDSKVAPGADVERHARIAGTNHEALARAAAMLKPDTAGFVGSAMHTGRVWHPTLHSLASQLVARASNRPFVGFRETALPFGPMRFADLRRQVAEGSIKMLFWTGGLFPYSYAGAFPELSKVEHLVATSIFIPDPPVRGLVLPLAAELERASAGTSYWGPIERQPLAAPVSGTREFGQVLQWFGSAPEARENPLKPVSVAGVLAMAEKAAAESREPADWLLVGEKKAVGLRGFHDPEETVKLNRHDAAKLHVSDSSFLKVKSLTTELEFQVHVTDAVPAGVLAVGVNVHRNRALFPLATDELTGDVTVTPVSVSVEKSDRVPVVESENRSVWS